MDTLICLTLHEIHFGLAKRMSNAECRILNLEWPENLRHSKFDIRLHQGPIRSSSQYGTTRATVNNFQV